MDQAKFKFDVFRHIVNKFIIEVLLVRLKVMMSRLRVLVTMTMTRLLPRVVVVSWPILSVFVVWDPCILHRIEGRSFMQRKLMLIESMMVLLPIIIEHVILFSRLLALPFLSFSLRCLRLFLLCWLSFSFFILSSRLFVFFSSRFSFLLPTLCWLSSFGLFGRWLFLWLRLFFFLFIWCVFHLSLPLGFFFCPLLSFLF